MARAQKKTVAEVMQPTIDIATPATPVAGTTKADIVPFSQATGDAMVRPVVTPQEAELRWKEYTDTCKAILAENDYIYFACGKERNKNYECKPIACRTRAAAETQVKQFNATGYTETYVRESKKRSAWDKLARFYGIETPIESAALCTTATIEQVGDFIVEKLSGDSFKIFIYQEAANLSVRKVSVLLRVVSPNGRTILGDGTCSTSERRNGADSFAHADHAVFGTAFTRAFNRGVSRCIGTGEVSAEEFEAATPEPQTPTTIASAPVQQVPGAQAQPMSVPSAPTSAAPALDNNNGVPKSEIPMKDFIDSASPSTEVVPAASQPPAPAVASSVAVSATERFAPLDETATLPSRIAAMKTFLFGSPKSEERLVEYLFFALHPAVKCSIEKNSRWNPDMWNAAMKGLEDRKQRMAELDALLVEQGKENFVKWGQAVIDAAKIRGIYVAGK